MSDPFLREGLVLAIDGGTIEALHELLAIESGAREAEEEAPARVFEAAAGYAPTLGILGAVLGLVQVMQRLGLAGVARIGHRRGIRRHGVRSRYRQHVPAADCRPAA